ncbi:hypothetical protein C481_20426 [Natrialba asiatica DSM 12278]|uniref:Uncharacterized protein n=1 Tax=Natrialba asiatica (strain ATCC 700177 / DSM 12278 / JCM 9576 / FERM P-10747 / NBRC 102637 / 172P1) TaxID=29540 RepID=M0AJ68_NATA1|nr:hypothetical protein C481_20426 [Natrialba asiatica DSM 12278]
MSSILVVNGTLEKRGRKEYTSTESPRPLGIPRLAARLTPSLCSVVAVLTSAGDGRDVLALSKPARLC